MAARWFARLSARAWASLLVLALLMTLLGGWLAWGIQRRAVEARVDEVLLAVAATLEREVDRDLAGLVGLALHLGDELPQLSAERYATLLDQLRLEGAFEVADAASLAQIVPSAQLAQRLAALPPDVRRQLDLRLSTQPTHLIITHTWPPWGPQTALGVDVLRQPEARDAASRAAFDGRAAISDPFERTSDVPGGRSLVAYLPVRDHEGDVVAVLTAVFVGQRLFDDVVAASDDAVQLTWVHAPTGDVLARSSDAPPPTFVQREVDLHDTDWRLEASASRSLLSLPERLLPWSLLLLAVTIAVAVVVVVVTARGRERRAKQLARERTEDLAATAHELAVANDRLRDADRFKDQLLATVSHDLRAPLTVIRGFVELLLADHPDGPEPRLLLERIEHQSAVLNRLVEDLLTASALREGATRASQRRVDATGVVAATVAAVGIGGLLDSSVQADVWADPDHLERIVTNLLVNALKYGQPPFEVEVRADGDVVEVVVRDHGSGLTAEVREAAFHPFTRFGDGRRDGVGLGLSIARELAELNGGTLRYEHPLAGGASFVLRLPIHPPHPLDGHVGGPHGQRPQLPPPEGFSPAGPT